MMQLQKGINPTVTLFIKVRQTNCMLNFRLFQVMALALKLLYLQLAILVHFWPSKR